MFRVLIVFALSLASTAALAFNPLPTGVLVRVGSDLNYYGACSTSANILEPGDGSASVLNVPACGSYWHTSTQAPPWTLVDGVSYGDVYMPDRHFVDCALIRQQIIGGGGSVNASLTVECAGVMIYNDGFDTWREG
jgi:hypothetical protein